ncbi:MAG: serine/threonine protein kinase [Burkholderiaceae bacterium]
MSANIALPVGYSINEYRIESTLGVGGFGLTYLATDLNLNLKVAIKEYMPGDLAVRCDDSTITPKSEQTEETFQWGLSRFLDESRTLASFRHPNIVRVMRYFQANQSAYMVLEFVQGDALNAWMEPRRFLPQQALLAIAIPLLDGLEVIHQAGFLHRDIKPNNIFIRNDGGPVLLDFGSARQTNANTEMTMIMTPGYAPFEQSHSHGVQGPWTDVYALGAVLYWMVTGEQPVEAAARIRNDILAPAVQRGDHSRFNQELLKAIDWALAPFHEARPQSAAEFRQALIGAGTGPILPGQPIQANAGASPYRPSASTQITPSTGLAFDSDILREVAAELANHMGPIAGVLVKSIAKKAVSLSHLIELSAAEIPDDKAREDFIKKFSMIPKTTPKSSPGTRATQLGTTDATVLVPAGARFDTAMLARAEAALAKHIGAVAKVVVNRAAKKARDAAELYLMIADEIEDKEERKAFVRKAIAARVDVGET